MSNILECNTKEALEMIPIIIKSGHVPMLWGGYGVGKSSIVQQYADSIEHSLNDIRAILYDSVDVRGFPFRTEDNKSAFATPAWLPDGSIDTVMLIDEITSAPAMVQASFYQLVLDKRLADYILPENAQVILAGNRQTDKGVYNAMPKPLCNRLIHLHLTADVEAWLSWAAENDVDPRVMAFIRLRKDLLHYVDNKSADPAQTTPRSLQFASDLLKTGIPRSLELTLLSGTIGQGTAMELISMMRIFEEMIDPETIINAPETSAIPEDLSTKYAICTCLANMATLQNFEQIFLYAKRMDPEWTTLIMSDATKRKPVLTQTKAYVKWAADNR
jgi:hypothetical protein